MPGRFTNASPKTPKRTCLLAYALHRKGEDAEAFDAIRRGLALGADVDILTVAGISAVRWGSSTRRSATGIGH
jgi:hypothetical protein